MKPVHDFTPWQPQRVIGFVGTWSPISEQERKSVTIADRAILEAAVDSAMEHALRKGGRRG